MRVVYDRMALSEEDLLLVVQMASALLVHDFTATYARGGGRAYWEVVAYIYAPVFDKPLRIDFAAERGSSQNARAFIGPVEPLTRSMLESEPFKNLLGRVDTALMNFLEYWQRCDEEENKT